jgi:hypothetical protein
MEINMAAGCDFICKNDKCKQSGKSIIMLGPWGLGDIDDVMKDDKVKNDKDLLNKLQQWAFQGRKHACINFPNSAEIDIKGYRINLWCDCCSCVWNYDIILNNNTLEEAMEAANLPKLCTKCGVDLINFDKAIKDSIKCPYCKENMQTKRWFSNE